MDIKKFMKFDDMVTPKIIQAVFVLLVIFWLGSGVYIFATNMGGEQEVKNIWSGKMETKKIEADFFWMFFGAIIAVFGTIFSRIICELLIVVFKIQDHLKVISKQNSIKPNDVQFD